MSDTPTDQIVCSAGCKRTASDEQTAMASGMWERLPITQRWRCSQCRRDLHAAREYRLPAADATPTDVNLARNAMLDSLDIAFAKPKEL